ncbi:MAG: type 1 glutamine amidotransferase [Planctomycetia bacterium]|nr:MAG: type 1 glutamine amidotransferase [Planctomycetia bacterium]
MSAVAAPAVLILAGDDYEDMELWYPRLRLAEAGLRVHVAGDGAGHVHRGKHGYPCRCDGAISEARSSDFHALVIPGGWMPDKLRRDPRVLALVREFHAAEKPIASICHGPWINISAGICRGFRMTGSPGVRDDVVNAGAVWEDAEVVVDRHIITSRRPSDLPAFCAALLDVLARRGD